MCPAGGQQSLQAQRIDHVTCLGCGCACDDIQVTVTDGRITGTANACALGVEWFGDGAVPAAVHVRNRDTTIDAAVGEIAAMLDRANAPHVFIAPDLSCEAQRSVTALADLLRASLGTISAGALSSILAAQERGRAGATLGEIRNRADVVVFWGVDPDLRYPRYRSRYAPDPAGLQIPEGRRGRTVIAVDVDEARGPADADQRVTVGRDLEVAMLTMIAAMVRNPQASIDAPGAEDARALAARLSAARYSAIVADGEVSTLNDPRPQFHNPQRAGALIALAHALNGPSRCALSTLRAGGNRSGADAVLTSQTGYPTGIDFSAGYPAYRPYADDVHADAIVIVGNAARIPSATLSRFSTVPTAIIGPGASAQPGVHVALDTGVAGIHCGGTAMRMDDVPLPLRAAVTGHRDPADVVRSLIGVLNDASARNASRRSTLAEQTR